MRPSESSAATVELRCPGCGRPVSECQAEDVDESFPAYPPLTRWQRFCWWLATALAPKDGSRYGPRIFGRRVKRDA